MPKYIDADALLAQMKDRRFYIGRRSDPVCIIEDAPAADVEPVRHGRWDYDSDGVPWCTTCGEPALQRLHLYLKIRSFSAPFEKSKFCPNCGAKMDKEEA